VTYNFAANGLKTYVQFTLTFWRQQKFAKYMWVATNMCKFAWRAAANNGPLECVKQQKYCKMCGGGHKFCQK
jgi:hypothetical protein